MTLAKPTIGIVFEIEGGNAGLTEEFVYDNQPTTDEESIAILSSATVESKMMGPLNKNAKLDNEELKIFNAPCIWITRNGTYAGTMKYIEKGQFTTNDHAYVMMLRSEWKSKVNLRWFISQYQELFFNLITNDGGNATFSKESAEKQEISIPKITLQNRIADKLHDVEVLKVKIEHIRNELSLLSQSKLEKLKIAYEDNIETIFEMEGGNSGLVEEFVYENQPTTDEEAIPILSGATIQSNFLGSVRRTAILENNRPLKVYSGPAILIIRKGLAGYMTYIHQGEFTTNDDAYVMTLKPKWKKKVNLRWFVSQYQELFKNLVTSKSDNATFNKEYAEKQKVKFPAIKLQKRIADKLDKIDSSIKNLDELNKQVILITQSKLV